jgi:hypothetical protein
MQCTSGHARSLPPDNHTTHKRAQKARKGRNGRSKMEWFQPAQQHRSPDRDNRQQTGPRVILNTRSNPSGLHNSPQRMHGRLETHPTDHANASELCHKRARLIVKKPDIAKSHAKTRHIPLFRGVPNAKMGRMGRKSKNTPDSSP